MRKIIVFLTFLFLVLVVGFFWIDRDYVLLYSGLSTSDTKVLSYSFQDAGINYNIPKTNIDEIEVKFKDVDRARRIAANTQLEGQVCMFRTIKKRGQKKYEFLENGNLRMLSQDEFRELKRQIFEGELSRIIGTFSGVDHANVKLSMPEHQLFTRDQEFPKASVVLTLLPESVQGEFTIETLKAIQRVVTYSIPDFKTENVHIIESNGIFDSQDLIKNKKTPVDQSSEILSIKNKYEDHYMKKLKNVLQIYEDKVHITSIELSADLTDIFEGQGSISDGEPGVESNLFPPEYQYSMGGSGVSTYDKGREIKNFEMDKTITEEKSTPEITVLSVAVMVDFSLEGEVDNIKDIVAKTFGFPTDPGLLDQKIAISLSQFELVKKTVKPVQKSVQRPVDPILKFIRTIITVYIVWFLLIFSILFISAILIGRDAHSRGMNSWGWGIFTFFVLFVSVPVYHVVRKPRLTDELPNKDRPNLITSTTTLSGELQNLVELKEQGILTDEEFQMAKKKLIGS